MWKYRFRDDRHSCFGFCYGENQSEVRSRGGEKTIKRNFAIADIVRSPFMIIDLMKKKTTICTRITEMKIIKRPEKSMSVGILPR